MHISLMAHLHMHKGKSFPTQTAFNLQPIFPLQRYCAKEVTTHIHFYESNIVGCPALSICRDFTQAYHQGVMKQFGIEKDRYKIGDWPRTGGVDEHEVFDQVTQNISQILRGIEFGFVEPGMISSFMMKIFFSFSGLSLKFGSTASVLVLYCIAIPEACQSIKTQ